MSVHKEKKEEEKKSVGEPFLFHILKHSVKPR
jgi:hypothetical protein